MTDDDKALVERLRGDWPEILVEKHWMMDSDAIDKQREEAADRIEALSAENERLKDKCAALTDRSEFDRGDIKILRAENERLREALGWFLNDSRFVVQVGGNPNVVPQMIEAARAALGETK